MTRPALTISEIDERLTACRLAYEDAIDIGDLDTADAMYTTMDELLEARRTTPAAQAY